LSFAATSHTDSLDGIPFEQKHLGPIAMTLVGDAGGASVVHPLIKNKTARRKGAPLIY
jgi:hypothetical protein